MLGAGLLHLTQDSIQEYFDQYQMERQRISSAEIAEKRYESGCVYLKSIASGGPATVIAEVPVFNMDTAGVLQEGTVVCDSMGGTAIIKEQRLTYDYYSPNGRFEYKEGTRLPVIAPDSIAFTGNPPPRPDDAPTAWIGRITNERR